MTLEETPEQRLAADLSIPCPHLDCLAEAGEMCKRSASDDCDRSRLVCFERRVKRLLMARRPDLLDEPS